MDDDASHRDDGDAAPVGGALVRGLLGPLQWIDVGAALAILLVLRPITGLIGMLGHKADRQERLTLAFFAIRGIGSIYYFAYGLNHMENVKGGERLWAIVDLIILVSILMHGLTVTPIMRGLDRSRGRDPDADYATPPRIWRVQLPPRNRHDRVVVPWWDRQTDERDFHR